jgi:para-nitrobenzyl esterase
MVWIHGGGFVGGASNLYDPSVIAERGHMIVVTMNYRLGVFGYLALPGLSAENALGTSGNYGLQDQQAALRWVRANIAGFGGDPRNVTIFGESAGGASVCDQIASPFATDLFQRAITESGPCASRGQTLATSQANGTACAASVGCSTQTVACMRVLSVSTLVTAATVNPTHLPISFSPNIDGVILPQAVRDALASGQFNHVPVLEGTNRNEDTVFLLAQISATGSPIPLTLAQYVAMLQATFGAAAPQVLAHYAVSSTVSPDQALADAMTDSRFACPAQMADSLFARAGIQTFAYEFSDPNPFELIQLPFTPPDFPLGDAHATELTYVFQGMLGDVTLPLTPAQLGLSDQMIAYWTKFALSGNPNNGAAPFWPRLHVDANRDFFQALTSAGNGPNPILTFSAEHQCAFWATLGI